MCATNRHHSLRRELLFCKLFVLLAVGLYCANWTEKQGDKIQKCAWFYINKVQKCAWFYINKVQKCAWFYIHKVQKCAWFYINKIQKCAWFYINKIQKCAWFYINKVQKCTWFYINLHIPDWLCIVIHVVWIHTKFCRNCPYHKKDWEACRTGYYFIV